MTVIECAFVDDRKRLHVMRVPEPVVHIAREEGWMVWTDIAVEWEQPADVPAQSNPQREHPYRKNASWQADGYTDNDADARD